MVSSNCFPPTDIRRYPSPRGGIPPYAAPYTGRRRTAYTHQDSRGSAMSDRDGSEEPSGQRKRIAVACVRCRKRKIKCTGDAGNGQPCHNCKNAGYEPCQFLRVSSHETALKTEPFSYNLEVARNYQSRGASMVTSVPASSMTSYPEAMQMSGSDALPYRNGSAYAYNGRQPYTVSGWPNGYSEDAGIDYAIYPQPYQPIQETGYMMSYRGGPSSAAPASVRSSGGGAIYVDSEAPFGYSNGSSAPANMGHRPSSNVEPNNFAFSNVSSGASNTLNIGDRLLPTPSLRSLGRSVQHPSRTESVSSAYSKTSQSSNDGSSPGPLSEPPTSYNSFENSPMATYHAPAMTSQISRPTEACSSNTALPSETGISAADEPLRLGPEMTYKYTDTTRRYTSQYAGQMASYISGTQNPSSYMLSENDEDRKVTSSMRV